MISIKKKLITKKAQKSDSEIPRVRKVIGQLIGIEKMITNKRHPPEIIQQIKAASSALAALRSEVLKRYLQDCLSDAALSGNNERLVDQILETIQMQASRQ